MTRKGFIDSKKTNQPTNFQYLWKKNRRAKYKEGVNIDIKLPPVVRLFCCAFMAITPFEPESKYLFESHIWG